MPRPRAICISRDADVARVVSTALAGAGVDAEHATELPAQAADVALVVVDRATRRDAGDALKALAAPVVVVGDDLDDDGLITLMLEAPVSHLVGDPGDRDLGITSEKLVSGDLFGLEKYLAPGAKVGERVVASDADKRSAMHEVGAWAEAIGARRPVLHRLASVIDELMMNALRETRAAVVRWAADDRTIAVSVADDRGTLRQRDVIDHVRRAKRESGRPETEPAGAGLGLYLVLANVASLIVNVDPGRRTEVVCLFDRARGRAIAGAVRSLHVFAPA